MAHGGKSNDSWSRYSRRPDVSYIFFNLERGGHTRVGKCFMVIATDILTLDLIENCVTFRYFETDQTFLLPGLQRWTQSGISDCDLSPGI